MTTRPEACEMIALYFGAAASTAQRAQLIKLWEQKRRRRARPPRMRNSAIATIVSRGCANVNCTAVLTTPQNLRSQKKSVTGFLGKTGGQKCDSWF